MRGSSNESFIHLLDSSGAGFTMIPPMSISDIQDVDLSAFPTSSAISTPGQPSDASCSTAEAITTRPSTAKDSTLARTKQVCKEAEGHGENFCMSSMDETTDPDVLTSIPDHEDIADECIETNREERSAFLSGLTGPQYSTHDNPEIPSDHVPCTGLRDKNVQAYVANTN
ncbi:hypothetical protein PsorP6_005329 [Peronosclerospora sorghi]|uniref:Uncharacterized protein n=1 Tax=Peronosclerospora sorghi TaxID=230839 RepID=A0ACC0W596_9STRA|nr:hypothetical protein PsorP6_005329 [Peronosclerospora sorghi]